MTAGESKTGICMTVGHSHSRGGNKPRKLAFYTIPLSLLVLAIKLGAWYLTGSIALLSDALESIVNVVASVGAFVAIVYASKPADHDHQFGHHKAEYISAVIEGVAIVVAALPDLPRGDRRTLRSANADRCLCRPGALISSPA